MWVDTSVNDQIMVAYEDKTLVLPLKSDSAQVVTLPVSNPVHASFFTSPLQGWQQSNGNMVLTQEEGESILNIWATKGSEKPILQIDTVSNKEILQVASFEAKGAVYLAVLKSDTVGVHQLMNKKKKGIRKADGSQWKLDKASQKISQFIQCAFRVSDTNLNLIHGSEFKLISQSLEFLDASGKMVKGGNFDGISAGGKVGTQGNEIVEPVQAMNLEDEAMAGAAHEGESDSTAPSLFSSSKHRELTKIRESL